MKTDKKGVSTCRSGQEQFEKVKSSRRLVYLQYDYRDHDGTLFTTAAPNLFTARDRRDKWLKERNGSKPIASDSVKDVMREANDQIQQLIIDRDVFFEIACQYETFLRETAGCKADYINNPEYQNAKLKIEEYENRNKRQRTSANGKNNCKKRTKQVSV